MATQHLSPALRTPALSHPYPKAKPGYGKRSTPAQAPATGAEFALLPARERYVAGFVDHLPDGSAMDIKTLAKQLPLYGQQAISSALTALSVAGHLRRVRRPAGEGDQVRWAFRTFWSRTARDNEWWNTFLATQDTGTPPAPAQEPGPEREADHPDQQEAQTPTPTPPQTQAKTPNPTPESTPTPAPAVSAPPSPAYLALAQLGLREPRLPLSAVDCETLQELAQGWFDRGVDADYLLQALTCGLPKAVDSPVGFVRDRLTRKLPPHRPTAPPPPPPGTTHHLLVECTECGAPGRPESLPDGLCGPCRRSAQKTTATQSPPPRPDARLLAGQIRGLLRTV
ncbi:MarR family transcriptional regulator [Streptomyces sp. NPDC012600]|uniref:MarR family transcriptional regulator n=1 Tax=unclassified Streptomyces TaxID=2593676 RepID=UPI0036C4FA7D